MSNIQPNPICKIKSINYKQLCKEYEDIVPVKILEKTYNVTIKTYKDQYKYSKLFNKNCEQNIKNYFNFDQISKEVENVKDNKEFIQIFSNSFYSNLGEKIYKNDTNKPLELFVNITIYLTESLAPWSIFFCATPSGLRLLKQVFQNDKVAIVTLFVWLNQIWLLNQYDNLFFRKELFDFLPTVITEQGIRMYFKQIFIRAGLIGFKKFLLSIYSMFEPTSIIVEIQEEKEVIDVKEKSIKKYEQRRSRRKSKQQSRQKKKF